MVLPAAPCLVILLSIYVEVECWASTHKGRELGKHLSTQQLVLHRCVLL